MTARDSTIKQSNSQEAYVCRKVLYYYFSLGTKNMTGFKNVVNLIEFVMIIYLFSLNVHAEIYNLSKSH